LEIPLQSQKQIPSLETKAEEKKPLPSNVKLLMRDFTAYWDAEDLSKVVLEDINL
jgi:hypothetical protein